jgi:hypothetical protein
MPRSPTRGALAAALSGGPSPSSPPLDRSSPELAVRNPDLAPDREKNLHSWQLPVYGRETMWRLFASDVLVSGLSNWFV